MISKQDELIKGTYLSHFGPLGSTAHLVLLLTQLRQAFPYGAFASTCSATLSPLCDIIPSPSDELLSSIVLPIRAYEQRPVPNGVDVIDINTTVSQLACYFISCSAIHSPKSVSQRTMLPNNITRGFVRRESTLYKFGSQLRRS